MEKTGVQWKLAVGLIAMAVLARSALAAPPDQEVSAGEVRRAALSVLREQYLAREMAFSPATRALAALHLERLHRDADALTPAQFQVGLAIAGALADNGHSGLRFIDSSQRTEARLPLRLLWMRDGLVVARAYGDAADVAGARVLQVEGLSPEALFESVKVLHGGNDNMRRVSLPRFIESKGILHVLGLAADEDALSFVLRMPDGNVVERRFAMLPVATTPPTAEEERLWSPVPVKNETGWRAALAANALPLYLQEANATFRVVPLPEIDALYVQFRSNQDEGDDSIAAFLETVNAASKKMQPRDLVVDMRFNIGGNILLTMDFMRALPDTVPGRTWLMVGPYTFSAGIVSAAAIKKHGGKRVTVVGEGMGDRMHFWSEGAFIELPGTNYRFRYTDGQFNLRHGCTGEPACVDDLYPINVNGISLTPEIPAPLTAADYLAGRDPAMDAVRARIRSDE